MFKQEETDGKYTNKLHRVLQSDTCCGRKETEHIREIVGVGDGGERGL